MPNLDFDVCNGKTFRDLCKDIIDRSQSKKDQLDTLLTQTRTYITDANSAIVFIPKLKELIECGIKNDEQLVKLSAVVQRLQSTQLEASGGDTAGLSEEEKEGLLQARIRDLETLKEIKKEVESPLQISSSL
jgi:hypothetical protein